MLQKCLSQFLKPIKASGSPSTRKSPMSAALSAFEIEPDESHSLYFFLRLSIRFSSWILYRGTPLPTSADTGVPLNNTIPINGASAEYATFIFQHHAFFVFLNCPTPEGVEQFHSRGFPLTATINGNFSTSAWLLFSTRAEWSLPHRERFATS